MSSGTSLLAPLTALDVSRRSSDITATASLDVSDSPSLTDESFKALLAGSTSLTSLSVAGCSELTDESFRAIAGCASLAALVLALALSFGSAEALTILQGESGPATLKTLVGDDARRFDNRLRGDDEFAREQQRRAQDRNPDDIKPAYCDSRYYKILAGGNGQGGVGCAN